MDGNNNNNFGNRNEPDIDEILRQIDNDILHAADDEKPIEVDEDELQREREQKNRKHRAVSLNELQKAPPPKKKKRKKKHKGIAVLCWILVIVILSVSISVVSLMAFTDITGISMDSQQEYDITIPEGSTTEQIANILSDAGAIKYPLFFRIYSRLKKEDGKYQYGYYSVSSSSGYEGIIETLQTVGATAEEKEITIPDGADIDEIINIFVDKGMCTKDEFKSAMSSDDYNFSFLKNIPTESVYYKLEGYLYPDTYKFAYVKGDGENNAKRAITKMLSTLQSKVFTDENEAKAQKMGHSMHEILTMASIVQMEAGGYPDEMPKVTQVFYNRLKWDEAKLLGSTPTSDYHGLTTYDTNKSEGLPPGPLDSPSLDAIEAALNPNTDTVATYFVTDKNHKFYYNNTFADHEATIANLKSEGIWEY